MKAGKLIERSVRSPEALKIIGRAFDDAWLEIADRYNGDARDIEHARMQLAHAVLAVGW